MTASLISVLHTGRVGAADLRFFASPASRPDLLWHAHDDLVRCLGLPEDLRREFHRALANGPFKNDVRMVATATAIGIATTAIAPHFAAQGLIGAAIEIGLADERFEAAYVAAGIEAMKALTAGMTAQAAIAFALAAAGECP